MSALLKFLLAKIISILILIFIINGFFIFYFLEEPIPINFIITLVLVNLFVIVDKIFQPLLLIGREKKNFKQASLLILFLLINPFLFAFPYIEYSIFAKETLPIELTTLFWYIGSIILIIGGITMCTARIYLGKFGFLIITIERTHKLITKGPYAIIRHPIYAGIILLFIGYTISFVSIFGFVIITGFFIIWFRKRIKLEEKQLFQTFGDDYAQYMKRTKKIIPFIY